MTLLLQSSRLNAASPDGIPIPGSAHDRCRPRTHRKEPCDLQGNEICRSQHETSVTIVRKILEEHRALQIWKCEFRSAFLCHSFEVAPSVVVECRQPGYKSWASHMGGDPRTVHASRQCSSRRKTRQPRAGNKPWANLENPFWESGAALPALSHSLRKGCW